MNLKMGPTMLIPKW